MKSIFLALILFGSSAEAGFLSCKDKIVSIHKDASTGMKFIGDDWVKMSVAGDTTPRQRRLMEEIQDCLAGAGENYVEFLFTKTNKLVPCKYFPLKRKWSCG